MPFGPRGEMGMEVLFWYLGMKVVIKPGDCFRFQQAVIVHKVCVVTMEYCNFINLFCHQSVWDLQKNKIMESEKSYWIDHRLFDSIFSNT